MPRFRNPVVSTANIIDGSVTTAKLADGAVTEPKLDTEAVTEAKLAALAVTAAKLADSSVTAAKIANLAVGTAAIANLAVTNAKIASLSVDKLTAGTISTGTIDIETLLTVGASGAIEMAGGEFRSDAPGTDRVVIDNANMRFYNGSTISGQIWGGTGGLEVASYNGGNLLISASPNTTSADIDFRTGNITRLFLDGSNGWLETRVPIAAPSSNLIFRAGISGGSSDMFFYNNGIEVMKLGSADNQLQMKDGTQSRPAITNSGRTAGVYWPDDFTVGISAGASAVAWFRANQLRLNNGSVSAPSLAFISQTDTGVFRSSTSVVGIASAGSEAARFALNNVWLTGAKGNTSASAANAGIISTDGKIYRSTSSKRYKTAVRPWDRRHSVLDLSPVLYRSTSDADDSRRARLGLLAEEVAEVFPIAAIRDEEARPDAIDWNMIVTGLIAEVAELEGRVAELEAA